MELAMRIRQGIADVMVFLLNVQLISQLVHGLERWMQPLQPLL
ncbi:MAG: hypothetical protein ACKOBY_10050 [Cyanobium sp.]